MTLQTGQPEPDPRCLNELQPWSPVIHGVPADLLRESFVQAQARHPDQDIRLRLG